MIYDMQSEIEPCHHASDLGEVRFLFVRIAGVFSLELFLVAFGNRFDVTHGPGEAETRRVQTTTTRLKTSNLGLHFRCGLLVSEISKEKNKEAEKGGRL